jgi:tetratricopeptide (TPR) repeat protein
MVTIGRSCTLALLLALAAGCAGERPGSRVIVLGLDGVDPDVVDLLVDEGQLPNFAKLKREGAYARLYSPPPLLSPIIWTTVATGRKPSDHGIGHFTTVDPATGEELPVTSRLRRVKALWNIFSEHDREVAVVGWWATWPAEPVRGALVSDHTAYHFLMGQKLAEERSSAGVTHPEELLAELAPLIRRPQDVGHADLAPYVEVDPAELDAAFEFERDLDHFRWALGAAETYRDIGLELWRRNSPDLLMVYVEGVDTTSHLFGHLWRQQPLAGELAEQQRRYGRAVEQMYRLADAIVGDYLAVLDERTTLVVLSDHGFTLGELQVDPSKTRDMRRVSEAYHEDEGILFLYGHGVRAGVPLVDADTLDIAPTVLAAAGLPVAANMPGQPLTDALEVEVARIDTYEGGTEDGPAAEPRDGEVDSAVLERLSSLGYIGAASTTNDRNLASILLREGRFEEAERAFRGLLEHEPDEAAYHAALATALSSLGRHDEALASFARAIELDPLNLPAYHNRGLLREQLGQRELAIQDYRTALQVRGEYEPARRALERLGEAPASLPRTPEELRAAELLGQASALMQRGDYGAAESLVAEAERLAPRAAAVHQARSNIAYLKGDLAGAETALERALELEPDNVLFRKNLRVLRERRGAGGPTPETTQP